MNGPSQMWLRWSSDHMESAVEESSRIRHQSRALRLNSQRLCAWSRSLDQHSGDDGTPGRSLKARRAIQCSKDLRWVAGMPLFPVELPARKVSSQPWYLELLVRCLVQLERRSPRTLI